MSKLANAKYPSEKFVLVVDDEIIKNKSEQEDFIDLIQVPKENTLFVGNYEEALTTIKSQINNIIFCFLDMRIPKNSYDPFDYTNQGVEWGEKLIKLIEKIKDVKIFIYSAYVNTLRLEQKGQESKNILGASGKPFIEKRMEIAIEYIHNILGEKLLSLTQKDSFDYSSVDKDTAFFLKLKSQQIYESYVITVERIFMMGKYLLEVKDKLDHGQFLQWRRTETPLSEGAAVRYMQAAKRFEYSSLESLDILPTGLYELAQTSTSERAIDEALSMAEKGEKITASVVKNLKKKYPKPKEMKNITNRRETKVIGESEKRKVDKSVDPLHSIASKELPSSNLPVNKSKQEILGLMLSQKAVKKSWWQLGENHQLFCGEPKDKEFLNFLPEKIALSINLLPQDDLSLVPSIKADSRFIYWSQFGEQNLHSLEEILTKNILSFTEPGDNIVFNYLLKPEFFNFGQKFEFRCIAAEPDLEKCEQILADWRRRSVVKRLK